MKFFHKMFIIFALLLVNCSGVPTKLYNPAYEDIQNKKINFSNPRPLFSEACGFQLLLVIPININDRQERAFRTLLNNAGREFVSDIEITETWTYGFVGTQYCTQLKAMSYPYNSEKEESNNPSKK